MSNAVTIDSHQHFWKYHPQVHEWINEDMAVIRKDFLPDDLLPVLQQQNIDGCVAVQADQSEAETDFLIGLANDHSFIKGVVGWVDLRANTRCERVSAYFTGRGSFVYVADFVCERYKSVERFWIYLRHSCVS